MNYFFHVQGHCEPNMFEQARIVAKIPARWPMHPSYMHSFGTRITKIFII
jgi:hypothetical protein